MKTGLNLRQGNVQTITMTPQLQQAIRLLQLSTVELQQEIQEKLDQNPFLEQEENSSSANTTSLDALREQESFMESTDDINPFNNDTTVSLDNAPYQDNQNSNIDYAPLEGESISNSSISHDAPSVSNDSGDSSDPEYWNENYSAQSVSRSRVNIDNDELDSYQGTTEYTLEQHLLWQLNLTKLSNMEQFIAEIIIDAINDSGYLTEKDEDILEAAHHEYPDCSLEDITKVIKIIQHFDPVGIAARNVQESLLIQLEQYESTEEVVMARNIISNYLDLLGKKDFRSLNHCLGIGKKNGDILKKAMDIIHNLEPRPGNCIPQEKSEYVIPDVAVRKINGIWVAELNPAVIPQIRLNQTYCELCENVRNPEEKQYIRTHIQEANAFIQSINKRNETLYRVSSCIVEHQQDFFEHGEQSIKPMVLNDIAMETGLHESTVSRVTTEKYIHTPRGTFELKYFFSSHVNSDNCADNKSSIAIRAMVKQMIAGENPQKPLSDSQLVSKLKEQGIIVARRTIAKYRESLNIPPSNLRKAI